MHLLYYAIGLALAVSMGAALGVTLSKEQGSRRILPVVLAVSVLFGIFLGYALDTFIGFVHASATMPL